MPDLARGKEALAKHMAILRAVESRPAAEDGLDSGTSAPQAHAHFLL